MTTTDLSSFVRDRARHVTDGTDTSSTFEFGAPRMHFESADSWSSLSGCMEWRAELRLSALDAHGDAPEVIAGAVQFLILRAGYESPGEMLSLYGGHAANFAELFDEEWLDPELDESDDFAGGMPISTVLAVLAAGIDTRVPSDPPLRAWALAETVHTMLPTTSGLVVMPALPTAARPSRHLVSADAIDPDCTRIGCVAIPGHPRFYGQVTAYVYLDEARQELAAVRDTPVRITVQH